MAKCDCLQLAGVLWSACVGCVSLNSKECQCAVRAAAWQGFENNSWHGGVYVQSRCRNGHRGRHGDGKATDHACMKEQQEQWVINFSAENLRMGRSHTPHPLRTPVSSGGGRRRSSNRGRSKLERIGGEHTQRRHHNADVSAMTQQGT